MRSKFGVFIAALGLLLGIPAAAQSPVIGIPSSGTSSVTSGVTAINLPHWIACTAKVKINAGNCRVYTVGDSTTFGDWSNGTSNTGDLTLANYPTRLSQYLNSTILPTQRDSFMGAGLATLPIGSGTNDGRVTMGSWTLGAGSGVTSVGGQMFHSTAPGAALTFLPTDNVDTFVIWYPLNSGLGTFSYAIDGGAATTLSQVGSSALTSVIVHAGSLGSHTVQINCVTGGLTGVYVVGVEAYNSAVGSVQIENGGWAASTSAEWSNSAFPWNPLPAIVTQAPDVVLLDLGINDWDGSIPVATYTANMQALITAWKVHSDVVLVTPVPSSISMVPLATQQLYINALYTLAAANNVPIIDTFSRWGSYELKNPTPYLFYGDTVHPDANGYSDFAQAVATQLLSITGR